MTGAKKRISKKGRSGRPAKSRAGDAFGDAFRSRLRRLIRAVADGNQAEFAAMCELHAGHGFHATRISGWLAGKVLPNLSTIDIIASATRVSVDWLLHGTAQDGTWREEPVYASEWREAPALEQDLARRILRQSRVDAATWAADGGLDNLVVTAEVIRGAVESLSREVSAWREWESRMRHAHHLEAERILAVILSNAAAHRSGYGTAYIWDDYQRYLVRMLNFLLPEQFPDRAVQLQAWGVENPRFSRGRESGIAHTPERPATEMFQPQVFRLLDPYLNQLVAIPLSVGPSEAEINKFIACWFGVLRDYLEASVPDSVPRECWMPSKQVLNTLSRREGGRRLGDALAVLTVRPQGD